MERIKGVVSLELVFDDEMSFDEEVTMENVMKHVTNGNIGIENVSITMTDMEGNKLVTDEEMVEIEDEVNSVFSGDKES